MIWKKERKIKSRRINSISISFPIGIKTDCAHKWLSSLRLKKTNWDRTFNVHADMYPIGKILLIEEEVAKWEVSFFLLLTNDNNITLAFNRKRTDAYSHYLFIWTPIIIKQAESGMLWQYVIRNIFSFVT